MAKQGSVSKALVNPQNLTIPLSPDLWGNVEYNYSFKDQFGVFFKTDKATIFAPETGKIVVLPDKTWVIEVDAGDHIRSWIGINPVRGLPVGGPVFGGQPLGTSEGDFSLALALAPKGSKTADMEDPAELLINSKAQFVDFQGPVRNTPVGTPQTKEITHTPAPGPQSARDLIAQQALKQEKKFTAGQAVLLSAGALLIGGTIGYLVK